MIFKGVEEKSFTDMVELASKTKYKDIPPGCRQIIGGFLNIKDITKYNLVDKKTNKVLQNSEIVREGKTMGEFEWDAMCSRKSTSGNMDIKNREKNYFQFCSKYSDEISVKFSQFSYHFIESIYDMLDKEILKQVECLP